MIKKVPCPSCGADLFSYTESCPHCGKPVDKAAVVAYIKEAGLTEEEAPTDGVPDERQRPSRAASQTNSHLMGCPSCAASISRQAVSCPRCGHPFNRRQAAVSPPVKRAGAAYESAGKLMLVSWLVLNFVVGFILVGSRDVDAERGLLALSLGSLLFWAGLIVYGIGLIKSGRKTATIVLTVVVGIYLLFGLLWAFRPGGLLDQVTPNEANARSQLEHIAEAEKAYQNTFGIGNFGTLQQLFSAGYISSYIVGGENQGYKFVVRIAAASGGKPAFYEATATPITYKRTGIQSFYISSGTGTVIAKDNSGLEYVYSSNSSLPPSAARQSESTQNLIGLCGYNPSDMNLVGRIVHAGPVGYNAYGQAEPGQRAVTMDNHLAGEVKVTYPRYLIVRACP